MPTVTDTRHTWTVSLLREPGDNWPHLPALSAKSLMLTPERVIISYARKNGRWQFEQIQVTGTRYRPVKAGGKTSRGYGTNTYVAGSVPEEYEELIREQRYNAGLELLT